MTVTPNDIRSFKFKRGRNTVTIVATDKSVRATVVRRATNTARRPIQHIDDVWRQVFWSCRDVGMSERVAESLADKTMEAMKETTTNDQ